MSLDPQCEVVLQAMGAAPRLSSVPLAEGRRSYDSLRSMGFGPSLDVGSIEEVAIPGPAGPMPARLYRPPMRGRRGLFLHIHGGGWVAGSIQGYDKESRAFSALGACSVLTFEYRLAPEAKFPAAVEDAIAAMAWAVENAGELGCDADRIAIGGDSAGANLAAVAAIEARDRALPLALQILIYPSTIFEDSSHSMKAFEDSEALSKADVEWAWQQYLRTSRDARDWRASPMLARTFEGLAPALVLTGGCDVLRDQGEAYAERMRGEGVTTTLRRYPGLPHGFFSMGAFVDTARRSVEETCSTLRAALE